MAVTLTDAVLETGLDEIWWYKNHLEALYCIEGEGTLEDLTTNTVKEVKPRNLICARQPRAASTSNTVV